MPASMSAITHFFHFSCTIVVVSLLTSSPGSERNTISMSCAVHVVRIDNKVALTFNNTSFINRSMAAEVRKIAGG